MTSQRIIGADGLARRLAAVASKRGHKAMLGELGAETVRRAKGNTRKFRKTGHLGREIKVGTVTDDAVMVISHAAYAAHVERGTRPHIIRARRARALRWAVGASGSRLSGSPRRGAEVRFARYVRHPGTSPQPYLVPAAESTLTDSGLVKRSIVTRWNGAN